MKNLLDLTKLKDAMDEETFEKEYYLKIGFKLNKYKFSKLYAFHMTRCTDYCLEKIKENNLLLPLDAKKIILYDICNVLKEDIKIDCNEIKTTSYEGYDRNIENDNYINGLYINPFDKSYEINCEYHFLDEEAGPEMTSDILRKIKELYHLEDKIISKYKNKTRPYIIKTLVNIDNVKRNLNYKLSLEDKILLNYLYTIYLIKKDEFNQDYIDVLVFTKNKVEKIFIIDEI